MAEKTGALRRIDALLRGQLTDADALRYGVRMPFTSFLLPLFALRDGVRRLLRLLRLGPHMGQSRCA
jgi:hypothetical protein